MEDAVVFPKRLGILPERKGAAEILPTRGKQKFFL
jgi:hypothetical protein